MEREAMIVHKDVLIEIFSRLPAKSLIRFKSLSKTWMSHISSPHFVQLHARRHSDFSAILISTLSSNNHFNFIPLDLKASQIPPLTCLDFIPDPSKVEIFQSRNGLLLCSSTGRDIQPLNNPKFYIYNPSTRHVRMLPAVLDPERGSVRGYCLIFEPLISSEYKVIVLLVTMDGLHWVEEYSSVTRRWRQCGSRSVNLDRFFVDQLSGVFSNGIVHWFDNRARRLLCFHVGNEHLEIVSNISASPEMEELINKMHGDRNFVDSGSHLYFGGRSGSEKLVVFKLEKDRSEWVGKCQFDLDTLIAAAYPHLAESIDVIGLLDVCVLPFVREESSLLVYIEPKIFTYYLKNGTFSELLEFPPDLDEGYDFQFIYSWLQPQVYFESLASV